MKSFLCLLYLVLILITNGLGADPTNYEYYTNGGIKSGLSADSPHFTLNGKQITLLSGSLHYFRLPQQYWSDRLLRYRSAGLNAVQTYVAWNIHEETPGQFDFETGFRNLTDFLRKAKETDLFVVIRIGPFICAEWEFGAFPPWLLRDPDMKLRTSYKPYLNAVEKYFKKVLSVINEYQFTKGGPIIALQFENEFGAVNNQDRLEYFDFMKQVIDRTGFKELLFNCNNQVEKNGMKGIFEAIDFRDNALKQLTALRESQPNKPLYVAEWWTSHYDSWGYVQQKMPLQKFEKEVSDVLFASNSSINIYMFFGGTNFAFYGGKEWSGKDVTTTYDGSAPISESGNYTDKYWKAKELFAKLTKERGLPKTHIPESPKVPLTASYGVINITDYLSLEDLLNKIKPIESMKSKYMEELNIGPNYGQNYGFILYRISTQEFKQLKISGGASDRAIVMIDGTEVAVFTKQDYVLNINTLFFDNETDHLLDIMVENTGRLKDVPIGSTPNIYRKGLNGDVILDNKTTSKYTIYPMEFKQKYVEELKLLRGKPLDEIFGPSLFRAQLNIKDKPKDTFLRFDKGKGKGNGKGNVFVNGFNIGRYYNVGPQKTLYIPAPLLKTGVNDIFVFSLHSKIENIEFVDKPEFEYK